jgi:tetratricopeptide (TPR) repeat protein
MPARTVCPKGASALVMAVTCLMLAAPAAAQTPEAESPPVTNSRLTAPLFYQLLIGEIELREGSAGAAYDLILDAARKTRDEQLFRRATEIALQARAGDQALAAVVAWRQALPMSLDALRYQVQLLVALNRLPETVEPLRTLLAQTPAGERPLLIAVTPRLYSRATDKTAAATALEGALADSLANPATATAARVAIGRAWLAARNAPRALALATQAHRAEPGADGPALLALELMPTQPTAEDIVVGYLAAKPGSNAVRSMYARTLSAAQRHGDAIAQMQIVVANEPNAAAPWLTLGALHLELRQAKQATTALERYVALASGSTGTVPAGAHAMGADDEDDDDDESDPARPPGGVALTQAYLMLAQAAELERDFPAAERWLARIDSTQQALEVQMRRASLLARQGKLAEARALIRNSPEKSDDDARAKLLAEAQILREAKQWSEAYAVLGAANERFPNDADLLYEQSMVAEKLDRMDDMERQLRRVMELQPNHHHAYNALGYSLAERNLRLEEARALIRKALELRPGEPFITDSLGWVEYRLGNREEAARLLRQAYQSRPDVEIATHLGEVLWVSGQRDEARRVLREARNRDATNDVLVETLARLQVDL